MISLLLTGASGFVGQALLERLVAQNTVSIKAVVRRRDLIRSMVNVDVVQIDDLAAQNSWESALNGVDVVVHAAARVHVMKETAPDPLAEFRRVNVAATLGLARQAVAAGVRRFIFISSIAVNGKTTESGRLFTADDVPSPLDNYGISKMEAEAGLRQIAEQSGMEVVVIRPPLIYGGVGVKGNFLSMMRWLYRGIPLPLGAIHNQRSLVGVDNLIDLIVVCLEHPAAANQTFLVSDDDDISTTQLLHRMARALSKPARLIKVPVWALKSAAFVLGRADTARSLCDSLQLDISKTQKLLGWHPPVTLDEGLKRAATSWLQSLNLK